MKFLKYLEEDIKAIRGSVLVIGIFDKKVDEYLKDNSFIKDVYYLNSNLGSTSEEEGTSDVKFHMPELHQYFKDGIDYVYCNYDEIKDVIPSFIGESIEITKKNLCVFSDKKEDLEFLQKKYLRFKINSNFEKSNDGEVLVVEINDKIVNKLKLKFYYFIDVIEKYYLYIKNNI